MQITERRERPILLSGEMVRSILDGRKTMTRRVIRYQPPEKWDCCRRIDSDNAQAIGWQFYSSTDEYDYGYIKGRCPYGKPGDRLWVRETWQSEKEMQVPDASPTDVVYRATDEDGWIEYEFDWKWRPPIHMPRWASRITLEVVDVRVERVQSISECDACSEGVLGVYGDVRPGYMATVKAAIDRGEGPPLGPAPRERFHRLWDSLNAKRGYSWASNPWVWVVGFRVVDK